MTKISFLKNKLLQNLMIVSIVLVAIFWLNHNEVKTLPPCLPGYVLGNTTITVNGCPVNIDICYKCAPHALVAAEVRLMSWAKIDTSCNYTPPIPNDSLLQIRIMDEFIRQRAGLSKFCSIPPCDGKDSMILEIYLPLCVQKSNTNGVIRRFACISKDGHCKKTVKVCATANGIIYTDVAGSYQEIGNGNCYLSGEPNDPVEGDTTLCYKVPSPCGTPPAP